jgi:hypothetical protein
MNLVFPAAFAANTLAMTALLIGFGLAGESVMAADVGIVQGASLALFYALSANARSLILNQARPVSARAVMVARLVLILPIAGMTFWISIFLSNVEIYLAAILILRRCVEWLGEVHLSELERVGASRLAFGFLIAQSLLLMLALAWSLGNMPMPRLGLLLWALLPLLFSVRFVYGSVCSFRSESRGVWARMLPHFGSTTIIGITVYVFRLMLLLMMGKHAAGDLFTAFALGGIGGSVFANALGPSIVLQEKTKGTKRLPAMLKAVIVASFVLGIVMIGIYIWELGILDWTGKTPFFWGATGFSLLGGVAMIYAQLIRLRLLQNHEDEDLFGPDIIMNVLIASVPLLFNMFGAQVMATLYLFSSLLALIFYWSYQKGERLNENRSTPFQERTAMAIAVLLLLPIFFQLSAGVFRDPSMYFSSGGILRLLPIPLSVMACYGGIILLGGYRRATVALSFIFFTCVLMVGSSVIASQSQGSQEQAKFILLIQFILPMFGMVLGQLYESKGRMESASLEKAFLYTLVVIVPFQLLCTWLQGHKFLTPYLYLFSVYQHLQYIPVIFVAAFLVAAFRLWQLPECRKFLFLLTPLMGIYAAASMSMLAIAMLLAGLLGLALYRLRNYSDKIPTMLLLTVALMTWGYLQYEKEVISSKFTFLSESVEIASAGQASVQARDEMPPNVTERLQYWKYYAESITSSPKVFLVGHAEPPDRVQYPSAHNYYLDFIYNFGMLALLPMLAVLTYVLTMLYRIRRELYASPSLMGLAFVALFLMLIDNSLKVGLRQPYPGIFSYFLIGLLIARISAINVNVGWLDKLKAESPGEKS